MHVVHPERSEGPVYLNSLCTRSFASLRMTTPTYAANLWDTTLGTAAGRGPVGHGGRGAACRICRDPQFHPESGVAGSRRLQETAAMFFDDAAAGAQRKGRGLVPAFGVERRRVRGWLRRRMGRRIVRREVNQDKVA